MYYKILIILVAFPLFGYTQKEANNWYFGNTASINFNSGYAIALTKSKMLAIGGCATISTFNGRLLFYTDGCTIWDSTHNIMPNGWDLCSKSTIITQSALIVPMPDSNDFFYVFTNVTYSENISYSIINMKLNSGKGDVVPGRRNIPLYMTMPRQKMASVKHGNGKDYWIVSMKTHSDSIYAWKLTSFGITDFPVITKTNYKLPWAEPSNGHLKISPNGKKVAFTNARDSTYIGDFDNLTGKISNIIGFNNQSFQSYPYGSYGLEFSPNSRYFYVSEINPIKIYQYSADVLNKNELIFSKKGIDTVGAKNGYCALQLGPDGKIYISIENSNFLSVIHKPDSNGLKCGLQKDFVYLEGKSCGLTLPNFISSNFQRRTFEVKPACVNNPTRFLISNTDYLDSVKWNFGDLKSGSDNYDSKINNVFHIYNATGNYKAKFIFYYKQEKDSSEVVFEINDKSNIKPDFNVFDNCEKITTPFYNTSTSTSSKLNYLWKFGDGLTSTKESPTHLYRIGDISQTFNVVLVATNEENGCKDSIVKAVNINSNPVSEFNFTIDQDKVEFKAKQAGNSSYKWHFGNGDSAMSKDIMYSYAKAGIYAACLRVTNAAECYSMTCKDINFAVTIHEISKKNGILIYPIPNNGSFNLEIIEPNEEISIEIFNCLSQKIYTQKLLTSKNKIELDLSDGIYLLKVWNGNYNYVRRIIVSR